MSTFDLLLPHHRQMLAEQSGISAEVIVGRGYRSTTKKSELKGCGFSESQLIVSPDAPSLIVPVWSIHGEIVTYQHRPDSPRVNKNGKALKYEFPARSRMALDVHPMIREMVRDPKNPLIITEGIKKADAAISRGLCCIALLGVWNWRGANESGGLAALPDWESIPLKDRNGQGRRVFIAFDSDVMIKREVYAALKRLAAWLKSRGAQVEFVYLASGDGGVKVGLDDFFAQGHERDDLLALATPQLREPPDEPEETAAALPYGETEQGLVWYKRTGEEITTISLTNFSARIIADVVENDGAETRRVFIIETRLKGHTLRFDIDASAFAGMNWHPQQLGARAILHPGQSIREHARTAIQMLSEAPEVQVRTHTGWVELGKGVWGYCHAGGVITGRQGYTPSVHVRLDGPLSRFVLPEPPAGEELRRSVRAVLALWELGREEVVIPACIAAWRAALETADFSLFLSGPTGVFKTELAALVQQHFGAGMDSRHLPADWSSTDNALEGLAFVAKDTLLVIDEYVPRGSVQDQQRHHAKADRVLRAQGNNSGRGRMRADGTLRPSKPPRGLILATGEDIPPGHSLGARQFVIEVSPGDINVQRLSGCQQDAAAGLYAQAMAAFLAYLAPRYPEIRAEFASETQRLREGAQAGKGHPRTPEITAALGLGLRHFLHFAMDVNALSYEDALALWQRGWRAIQAAAKRQARYQQDSEPAHRLLELLQAALASGRAHLAALNGTQPINPLASGWRDLGIGSEAWRPQGQCIGWVDGNDLYLLPEAAYQCAQRMAEGSGDAITVRPKTLNKRLKERGLLHKTDEGRGTLTVRKMAGGARQEVLHLHVGRLLCEESDQSDQSAAGASCRSGNGQGNGQVLWSERGSQQGKTDHENCPESAPPNRDSARDGQIGQILSAGDMLGSSEQSRSVDTPPKNGHEPDVSTATGVGKPPGV